MKNIFAFIFFILATPTFAAEKKGITFEDTLSEQNVKFVLNGLGVRKYLFASVYVAGLYATEKSKDADQIINSSQPKIIKMHYFEKIGKEDFRKAWEYSFKQNCPKCEAFQPAITEFLDHLREVQNGTKVTYYFDPKYVEIRYSDKTLRVTKDNFAGIALATWIGKYPPTESLKEGLLGK